MAAGGAHSMALGSNGKVWSFGWNRYGQLGRRQGESTLPDLVEFPRHIRIKSIAVGEAHSVMRDTMGGATRRFGTTSS